MVMQRQDVKYTNVDADSGTLQGGMQVGMAP